MSSPRESGRARRLSLADRLHSVSIHVLRLVRTVDVDTGLGPAQLSALSVLVFGGPASPGRLAAAEQVRPPSMTRVVKELEAGGHVRRFSDRADRRVVRLEATQKGRHLLLAGQARRVAMLADWLTALSARDLGRLEDALPVIETVVKTRRAGSSLVGPQ
jgi:DNA-binding MarR family transcriptional regulator